MNWQDALAWTQARNAANWLGHADWRLPNAKELQSIMDYTRSPATTNSAAMNALFLVTPISTNEYPYYWTSTTHLDNMGAVYLCPGRGLGWMQLPPLNQWQLYDVHGAGCQRSDPKTGSASSYPHGLGPQGDVIRIENYVRLVRGGAIVPVEMSSFKARALPGSMRVLLEWTTEREVNNLGFTVERRPAGGSSWEEVPGGFIAGHGTVQTRQAYSYIDTSPSTGVWAYRIKQIDADGASEYSDVRTVSVDASPAERPSEIALRVYPNPSASSASISYVLPTEGDVTISICNSLGVTVREIPVGNQSAGSYEKLVEANDLAAGVYMCSILVRSGSGSRLSRATERLLLVR
jgi:hypothetical protein